MDNSLVDFLDANGDGLPDIATQTQNFIHFFRCQSRSPVAWQDLRAMKSRGEKIAALTAYDYPGAKLLDDLVADLAQRRSGGRD